MFGYVFAQDFDKFKSEFDDICEFGDRVWSEFVQVKTEICSKKLMYLQRPRKETIETTLSTPRINLIVGDIIEHVHSIFTK